LRPSFFRSTADDEATYIEPSRALLQLRNAPNEIYRIAESNPNYFEELKTGMFPLHMACRYNRPLCELELLVQQNSDSVKAKANDGRIPLHYACENNAPLEVLEFLVQQYPDSVTKTDRSGLLPLHIACDNSVSLEVLEFLV